MTRARARAVWLLPALLLAWLVARNAMLLLYAPTRPDLALAAWPQGGTALAAAAHARIWAAGGAVDEEARALTRSALRRAPGSDGPLVLAGLAASADGDMPRAEALMRAASTRNPRSDEARFWLLDHFIRTGRYAEGLDEIGPALRLRPATHRAILAMVAGLLRMPGGTEAVRARLATDPDWRADFFASGADPERMLALLRSLPPPRDPAAAAREQAATLSAAVTHGAAAEAYRSWLALPYPDDTRHIPTIYDPDFEGLPRPAPFNWQFWPSPDAEVMRTRTPDLSEGGALTLAFHGTTPALLAEQIALVATGAARLTMQARRIGEDTGARLVARVRCVGDDTLLATLRLGDIASPTIRQFDAPLTIPPGCTAVRVRFGGEPGDTPGRIRVQVTGVTLLHD